jgi:hypothetical protein
MENAGRELCSLLGCQVPFEPVGDGRFECPRCRTGVQWLRWADLSIDEKSEARRAWFLAVRLGLIGDP